MTKAITAVLVLTFTCLLALSAARPGVLNQEVSLQTDPNIPRTFLGKPYRQRRDVQGCSRPCCTLAIGDRNDSHTDVDADVSTHQQTVPITCPLCVQNPDAIALVGHDHVSAHGTLADNDGRTKTNADTEPRGKLAPPLVVNSSPESGSARSRLMKSKQASRLRNGPGLGDVPLSSEVRSDGISLTEKDAKRTQSRVVSTQSTRQVAFAVGRWKRLYDRGEWKSRLLEEYQVDGMDIENL